ncbi:hypothetical protein [Kosakonia quasisacchari]|uniref:hypothetical protein n=1 Tax=Kosakonia quasisacchari TaxID=2529380 RepID=UPI0039DF80B0
MKAQLSRERLEEKLLEHIKHGGDSEEEAMIRMLLAGMDQQPIAWLNDAYLARGVVDGEAGIEDAGPGYIPAYREPVPPATVAVPDGYCLMPQKLTAANGAKGALSGEFHIPRTVACRECGGDGCDDQGEWEEEIPIGWGVIKLIYAAAVEACALTATPAAHGQEA